MALIRHAFGNFLPRSKRAGEAAPGGALPTAIHSILKPVTVFEELQTNFRRFAFEFKNREGVMQLLASRKRTRLPKRFPVGTTYVVEGRGGENGDLRVYSRYVVLPSGERINLGGDFARPAPPRVDRRARSRSASRTSKSRAATRRRSRTVRVKKIIAPAGTRRRHRR
jgi:hypothetical protein